MTAILLALAFWVMLLLLSLAANADLVLAYDAFGYSLLLASTFGLIGLWLTRKKRCHTL